MYMLSTLRFLLPSLVTVSGTYKCFIASPGLSLVDEEEEEEEGFLTGELVVLSGTLLRRQRSICTTRFLSPRWEDVVVCSPRPNGTRVYSFCFPSLGCPSPGLPEVGPLECTTFGLLAPVVPGPCCPLFGSLLWEVESAGTLVIGAWYSDSESEFEEEEAEDEEDTLWGVGERDGEGEGSGCKSLSSSLLPPFFALAWWWCESSWRRCRSVLGGSLCLVGTVCHSRLCCCSLLLFSRLAVSSLFLCLSITPSSSSSSSSSSSAELWIQGRLSSCSSASLLSSFLSCFPCCFSLCLSSFLSGFLLSPWVRWSPLCSTSCSFGWGFFCIVFVWLTCTGVGVVTSQVLVLGFRLGLEFKPALELVAALEVVWEWELWPGFVSRLVGAKCFVLVGLCREPDWCKGLVLWFELEWLDLLLWICSICGVCLALGASAICLVLGWKLGLGLDLWLWLWFNTAGEGLDLLWSWLCEGRVLDLCWWVLFVGLLLLSVLGNGAIHGLFFVLWWLFVTLGCAWFWLWNSG